MSRFLPFSVLNGGLAMHATPSLTREVLEAIPPGSGMHSSRGLLKILSPDPYRIDRAGTLGLHGHVDEFLWLRSLCDQRCAAIFQARRCHPNPLERLEPLERFELVLP
jgi:hypothetical protein